MRGVLLDLDGTLLDSNDAHAHAWAEAIEGFGSSLPFERVRDRIGKGGDKLLWELLGLEEQSPEGKHISQLKKRIFQTRYLSQLVAFPGSRELLMRMRQAGLRLVLATSSGKDELENLLDAASLGDLIEHRVTKDDVAGCSKPDPDIVEVAVRQSELAPAELVMLGDTPFDIEAAGKAHVKTIAVRCGGWSDASLAGSMTDLRIFSCTTMRPPWGARPEVVARMVSGGHITTLREQPRVWPLVNGAESSVTISRCRSSADSDFRPSVLAGVEVVVGTFLCARLRPLLAQSARAYGRSGSRTEVVAAGNGATNGRCSIRPRVSNFPQEQEPT